MKCGCCGAPAQTCPVCGDLFYTRAAKGRGNHRPRCTVIANALRNHIDAPGRFYVRRGSRADRAARLAYKHNLPIFQRLSPEVRTRVAAGKYPRSYHVIQWENADRHREPAPGNQPETPAEWLASL